MTGPLLTLATMMVMEPVAAAVHRFIGHGIGWSLHRDHHDPGPGLLERNDLIPVGFAGLAMAAFAAGVSVPGWMPLFWVALGVTLYGLTYALIHDVYIHRRVPLLPRRLGWLEPLRTAHMRHHRTGGRPYGVVVPVPARRLLAPVGALAVAVGSFALYRGAVPGVTPAGGDQATRAAANAATLARFEATLGIDVESAVHGSWLADSAVGTGLALFYTLAYWPFLASAVGLAAYRNRAELRLLANAAATSGLAGLVAITLWPVAPPRLTPGFSDPVADLGAAGPLAHPSGLFNPYAAFPSFHVAWTALAGVTLYRILGQRRGRTRRALAATATAAVPAVMAVAVVSTANHWVLDVVAGVVLAAGSRALSHPLQRAFGRAWTDRQARRAAARSIPVAFVSPVRDAGGENAVDADLRTEIGGGRLRPAVGRWGRAGTRMPGAHRPP